MGKDVAIPIIFPNYLIMVETPNVTIDVPDFLPGIPNEVKIPKVKNKIPYLGHAGILFFQGTKGTTKYFEYGRYDAAAKGLVRKQVIPDVRMGVTGRPTLASLSAVLSKVSRMSGQNGAIVGAYIELEPGAFSKMLSYATVQMGQNSSPSRKPYELLSHSCLHFMKETASAGGADMPWVIDPRPAGYIERVRGGFPDLDFAKGKLVIEGITLK